MFISTTCSNYWKRWPQEVNNLSLRFDYHFGLKSWKFRLMEIRRIIWGNTKMNPKNMILFNRNRKVICKEELLKVPHSLDKTYTIVICMFTTVKLLNKKQYLLTYFFCQNVPINPTIYQYYYYLLQKLCQTLSFSH